MIPCGLKASVFSSLGPVLNTIAVGKKPDILEHYDYPLQKKKKNKI